MSRLRPPAALLAALLVLGARPAPAQDAIVSAASREEIFVLRSIREPHDPAPSGCPPQTTGFPPFPADAERVFSFWTVALGVQDGRMIDGRRSRAGMLRGCFGPTEEPARQNFYAEIALGAVSLTGKGECRALMIDAPEPGLFPVRCQLILGDLPAPYVGGLLTTNTLTSRSPFGGDTDPPGYTQASIAIIRLWTAP